MNLLDRFDIMRAEGLTEDQVWDSGEIQDIPQLLKPEIRTDVPGLGKVMVWGNPIELGDVLDFQQGYDNPYGAFGTCGENSVSNVCKIAGMDVSETEVLEYAMENDECIKFDPKTLGGGSTIGNSLAQLEHFGLEAHCEFAAETATPERLAEAIEGGHGVMLGLNSGLLQDRDWKIYNDAGEIHAEHAVTLTGTVRDMDDNLEGFYLCDSSGQNPDSGRTFVPIEDFNVCYSDVQDAFAIITDDPIRW